jgi:hypothetical protein
VSLLLEICLNRWLFNEKPNACLTLGEFLKLLPLGFAAYAKEGERELSKIIANFMDATKNFHLYRFQFITTLIAL